MRAAKVQVTTRDVTPRDIDAISKINADCHPGVSVLTPGYFEQIIQECALFRLIEAEKQLAGYLCAMNRYAAYDGEEFQWFRGHFREDFLYIDQVAIGRYFRRIGLGRILSRQAATRACCAFVIALLSK